MQEKWECELDKLYNELDRLYENSGISNRKDFAVYLTCELDLWLECYGEADDE